MTAHVFVGPSLSAHSSPEGPLYHPPIAHGDLLGTNFSQGDTVVIVDGYFHSRSAIKHKEILAVASEGITIFGASSIGALRAAEIPAPWMIGVGKIYEEYSTGIRRRDDDVMLVHDPSPPYTEDSLALVNWQALLAHAAQHGVLDNQDVAPILQLLQREHYSQRTFGTVHASRLIGEHKLCALRDLWSSRQSSVDLKASDALEAIRLAMIADGTENRVPSSSAQAYGHTSFIETWKRDLQPDGGKKQSYAYEFNFARLFCPDFAHWLEDTLEYELRQRHAAYYASPSRDRMTILSTQDPRAAIAFSEEFVTAHYDGWAQLAYEAHRAVEFEEVLRAQLNIRPGATFQDDSTILELLRKSTLTSAEADLERVLQQRGFRTWESAVSAAQPFAAYMQYKMQI